MLMNKNHQKCLIKFLPSKKTIEVPRDYNLRQAILDCDLELESSCGGVGTCGKCRVRVIEGDIFSKKSKFIDQNDAEAGFVLACLSKVKSNLIIDIPEVKKSKAKIEKGAFSIEKQKKYVSVNKNELSEIEIKPWIIKEIIEVEKPILGYSTSDIYRLKKSINNVLNIEDIKIPINLLRELPFLLREKKLECNSYSR